MKRNESSLSLGRVDLSGPERVRATPSPGATASDPPAAREGEIMTCNIIGNSPLGESASQGRRGFAHYPPWPLPRPTLPLPRPTLPLRGRVMSLASLFVAVAILVCFSLPANAQDSAPTPAAIAELLEVQKAIQKNLKRLEQATVCLQEGGGSGSGVIVSEDGLILTAAHVVGESKTMTVRFHDDRQVTCKVLGTYGPADAAMAQIIEEGPYVVADIAPAGSLKVGDTVFALGNPGGFDIQRGMPLRIGHVSKTDANFMACDCALIGGDSGGPSFNLQGQVVGIHSNISGSVATNNDVHIDAFHRNWDAMKAGERKGRVLEPENQPDALVVGLRLIANEPGEPIRIAGVVPNTPAAWAGLKSDDEILTVNKVAVTNANEFVQKAKAGQWGRTLKLGIKRDDQPLDLTLELMTFKEVAARKKELRNTKGDESDASETSDDEEEDDEEPQEAKKTIESSEIERIMYQPPAQEGDDNADEQRNGKLSELRRLMEEAKKNGGRIKIDRAKLRELNLGLSKRVDKLSPVGGRANDDWAVAFQRAFLSTANRYADSIYPVLVTGRVSAVATAVSDQGYFVTKASEIEGRKFQIQLRDDVRIDATQVAIDRDNDLALIKVEPGDYQIPPVDLSSDSSTAPPKGTICCCLNHKNDYLAGFGIVSVAERSLNGETGAVLGLSVKADSAGLTVIAVADQTSAKAVGLKVGDVLTSFGDKNPKTVEDLQQLVQKHLPEDEIRLGIKRGENLFSVAVTLGHRSKLAPMAGRREQALDKVSAKLSRRRWGFERGIQHDCAIRPSDCGGLLVDLHGKIIGLNIARAGRIKSYAAPTHVVQKFVDQAITDHANETAVNIAGESIR